MKIIVLILLFPVLGFGQDAPYSGRDTVYLDKNWYEIENKDDAVYYRFIQHKKSDSILLIQDYYVDSKSLQMTGSYLGTMENHNQIGIFNFYYRNGNLKTIYNYENGRINGKVLRFYENEKNRAKI